MQPRPKTRRPVLPVLTGKPIRVVVKKSLGWNLGSTSIPGRLIHLNGEVLLQRGDFERILIHEIFHFVWVRLSNAARWDWEAVLRAELDRGVAGELGWSAEWRKAKLKPLDVRSRSVAWRVYACESFCDSAAWLYSDLGEHDEFTLAGRPKGRRRAWFDLNFGARVVVAI